MQCANIISAANKPFWMQVGFTGISAVFMVHLAAAVPNASRDHVSLFKLLEHSLLTDPLQIAEGMAGAPEKPGFGVEIDMDAIDKYRLAWSLLLLSVHDRRKQKPALQRRIL